MRYSIQSYSDGCIVFTVTYTCSLFFFFKQKTAYEMRISAGSSDVCSSDLQMFCMGCHSGIGVTVDGSFSLPRKLPGAAGWGVQRLTGMLDAPQAGSAEPEYQRYLRRARGGAEYRRNAEMLARFFPDDHFNVTAANAAAGGGGGDLRSIIPPSHTRKA